MGQLRQAHQAIVEAGGRLLAVSVDDAAASSRIVERLGLPFPILADTGREVIRKYGVVHAKAGPDGGDIAIPSHFLIDTSGKVVFRYIASRLQDRPNPETDIAALIALRAR